MKFAVLMTLMLGAMFVAIVSISAGPVSSQVTADSNPIPNPYVMQKGWAKLPIGRQWGSTIGVEIDPDGRSVWTYDRCGGRDCINSTLAPIQKFDANGDFVTSFGIGMIDGPHGFHVDREGNVWVSDALAKDGKGNTVFKFSKDGKLLMTLGKPGMTGEGPDGLDEPTDVYVAPNGDIFVSQGHGVTGEGVDAGIRSIPRRSGQPTDRIIKFAKDGTYIKSWGKRGSGPGELNTPHSLQMDGQGRLFVADRANNRIQIFDQDGKYLSQMRQFGRPSGIYIDKNDMLYATDHQSADDEGRVNPGFQKGIRIGSVKDGKVVAFIPEAAPGAGMPEAIATDAQGTIYAGWTVRMNMRRYVKR